MTDERLRTQVLSAVAQGLLPADLPKKTWGGSGSGNACAVCGKPISTEEIETEFENGGSHAYHLHIHCFAAWEAVVRSSRGAKPYLPLSLDDRYSAAGDQPLPRRPG